MVVHNSLRPAISNGVNVKRGVKSSPLLRGDDPILTFFIFFQMG